MKKIALVVLFAVLAVVPMTMTGCGNGNLEEVIKKNKDAILKALNLAAEKGTEFGLKKWSKNDENAAKEAATALSKNLKEEILPYLDGEELHTSAEVNEFINSSLFKNIPDEVKDAIVMAAVVLDLYLPIPGSDKLTEDQRDYLKAFLSGIQKGCDLFIGDRPEAVKRYWITGEQKISTRHWITGEMKS